MPCASPCALERPAIVSPPAIRIVGRYPSAGAIIGAAVPLTAWNDLFQREKPMRATVSGKLSAILGCAVMAAFLTACGDHGPKQEPASQTPPATSDQTSTEASTSTAPPATSPGSATTVSTPTSGTP